MYFDPRWTRYSPADMSAIDDYKSTLCKSAAHNNFYDRNAAPYAASTLLNSQSSEDVDDRMHPSMDNMKPPTVYVLSLKVNSVVRSRNKLEEMVAMYIFCTTERVVVREISTILHKSLKDILHGPPRTHILESASSSIPSLERSLLDVLQREITSDALYKHTLII